MGTIIEFRRPETARGVPPAEPDCGDAPAGHSAEIIIFPGVRIERHSHAPKAERAPVKANGPISADH